MKIAIGTDHAGYDLKEQLKKFLSENSHEVVDCGCKNKESCDYPEYGIAVAEKVAKGGADRGVLVCTTGIGMSIAANKVKGIRAALCLDVYMAEMSRKHNDANVLVLASAKTDFIEAKEIILKWLSTDFEGGRHQRRVDKIKKAEE